MHPLVANDHVHTRLTHSLEVAQVGKTLGKTLGERLSKELPRWVSADDLGTIVEAACLAHDLGNPPFGHGGEEAMTHWFESHGQGLFRSLDRAYKRDLMFFEGNAQGFRVLTQTENHLFKGGLRLTYPVLVAFLKYPWTSRKPGRKFGAFLAEEPILDEVARHLGLVEKHQGDITCWARHPLAYLVEAADDICYGVLDLEDAVELRILPYEQVAAEFLKPFSGKERRRIERRLRGGKEAFRVNLARLRGHVFE